jgi:hypothetical protein
MTRRHIFSHSRIPRTYFTIAFFLIAGFVTAEPLRAQDDFLSVSPIPEIGSSSDTGLRAYIATLPSAPTPKVEATASAIIQPRQQTPVSAERTRPFYWLDRKSVMFGLVQGGAEVFDGVTTRYFIHHCSLCFENDPMSRLLLGTHPSWGKMIPIGIGEAALSTYSYRRLSHSPNRLLRGAAPLVPIGLTAVHVIEGARNITLKNKYRCADPGYVVVVAIAGAVCVPAPPPVVTGVPGAGDGGFGSRSNPL